MSQTAQIILCVLWNKLCFEVKPSVWLRACEAFDQKRMYTHTAAMSDESAQA